MARAAGSDHFLRRVFLDEELEYARGGNRMAQSLAGSFAAREACAKACGQGLAALGLRGVGLRRGSDGPSLIIDERVGRMFRRRGVTSSFVSISYEEGMAVAVVVLEGRE